VSIFLFFSPLPVCDSFHAIWKVDTQVALCVIICAVWHLNADWCDMTEDARHTG
jgi:hypothetical protein